MNKQAIFVIALIFCTPLIGVMRGHGVEPALVCCSPNGQGWKNQSIGKKCMMPLATIVSCVGDCVLCPFVACNGCAIKCARAGCCSCPPPNKFNPYSSDANFCSLTAELWGWNANPTCSKLLACYCLCAPKIHVPQPSDPHLTNPHVAAQLRKQTATASARMEGN